MDKKNLMAPYQQSFRIDDLLTRKASEQQPPHFCPPLLTTNTTTSSSTSNNNNNSNDSLQPSPLTTSLQPPPLSNLLPPPLGQMGAQVKIENSMSYHPKVWWMLGVTSYHNYKERERERGGRGGGGEFIGRPCQGRV